MALFYARGVPIGAVAIMLAIVASMGGFIFGYDTGQISDILLMDDFKLRFATCGAPGDASSCEFSDIRAGLIVSLLSIGTLVGALMGAPVADILGRRYAMVAECILFIIGVIIQMVTVRVWQQFAIGRLVSGLAVGGLSAAVPMYQAETAPAQIRGSLTATYQLFITFGILVAYCVSIGARDIPAAGSWRTVVGIGIVWPFILAVGILFMPESPRWLGTQGRFDEARAALARTRGVKPSGSPRRHESPDTTTRQSVGSHHSEKRLLDDNSVVDRELEQIKHYVESQKRLQSEQKSKGRFGLGGWAECFSPRNKILYRTLLGMSLQSLQQLTGANYFFYYGATVFTSVGIQDSFVTQIILGAVNFGCTFGGIWVMERFGRRVPLILGGIWQSIWLFVFAAAGTARDPTEDSSIGKLMIVSACMFILGYATTWAPGVWILIGETFPTRTRAKQGALATASNWLWNFLLAFFTPFIIKRIAFRYGFLFAACNLLGACVVYFFLYESSHLTLESVDDMYNDTSVKPWTSRAWGKKRQEEYSNQHRGRDVQEKDKSGMNAEDERIETV